MEQNKCPKCGGEFEEGFCADASYSRYIKPQWATNISFWTGLKNARNVISYRCKQCGFLESYAK